MHTRLSLIFNQSLALIIISFDSSKENAFHYPISQISNSENKILRRVLGVETINIYVLCVLIVCFLMTYFIQPTQIVNLSFRFICNCVQ